MFRQMKAFLLLSIIGSPENVNFKKKVTLYRKNVKCVAKYCYKLERLDKRQIRTFVIGCVDGSRSTEEIR